MTESPELAAAKPLLDAAKDPGFTFEWIAVGETRPCAGCGRAGRLGGRCPRWIARRTCWCGIIRPAFLTRGAMTTWRPRSLSCAAADHPGRRACPPCPDTPESWRPDSRLAAGGAVPDSPLPAASRPLSSGQNKPTGELLAAGSTSRAGHDPSPAREK